MLSKGIVTEPRLTVEAQRDMSSVSAEIIYAEDHLAAAAKYALANYNDRALARVRLAEAILSLDYDDLEEGYASGLFGDITNWLLERAEIRHGEARSDRQELAHSFIHALDREFADIGEGGRS